VSGFKVECVYCSPTQELFSPTPGEGQDPIEWARTWKAAAPSYSVFSCAGCGGSFGIEDDGVDADLGGIVQQTNVSRPRLDSLSVTTGPRGGGNALFISGIALDVGTLVVKFDGKSAAVDSVTSTSARVVVPVGVYRLHVAEHLHTLTLTINSGSLAVDEAVTTAAGSTGIVRHISGATYMIVFQTLVETLSEMVGTVLTGGVGGGVATVDAADLVTFVSNEQVFGLTSGSFGTARGGLPLIADAPTNAFAPNELVKGSVSGAMVKLLGSPANSGAVDVVVENENGQRSVGGTLVRGYTYA
jgi:hypothetical protein